MHSEHREKSIANKSTETLRRLFFAFEAPQAVKDIAQGITRFHTFGFLSDLLPILTSLSAWGVIVALFQLERKGAPRLSAVAVLLGIAGNLGIAVGGILIMFHDLTGARTITVMEQILITLMSSGPVGLWQVIVSYRARREGLLPSRLTGFGILLGVGQMAAFVMLSLFGGWSAAASSSPSVILSNYPLLISLVIGVSGGLVGYIGAPVWAIGLGRTFLLNEADRGERFAGLASFPTLAAAACCAMALPPV